MVFRARKQPSRRPGQRRSPLQWTGGPATETDQPDYDFSPGAVVSTLRAVVGGAGEVVTRFEDRRIWIFPRGAGTPIHLFLPEVEPGACDVYAGFAFQTTVLAQTEADNGDGVDGGDIVGLVRAITRGEVTELFDFGDADPRGLPGREFGYAGHRTPTSSTDDSRAVRGYPIPAWEHPLA